MPKHTIRLRAPWTSERQGDGVVWRRNFGRPSGLSADERVLLVFQNSAMEAAAALNDKALGTVGDGERPTAFDVTKRLQIRNVVTLRIGLPGETPAGLREPPVDVRLEIESGEGDE